MQIAVISDLHLGSGDVADRFGHDDQAFLRFLEFLERNFERVVLLGDIWETLASRRPGDATRELARCRAAHPELAERFRRLAYSYVHGNHDLVARDVDGAPSELTISADGVRLLFAHGHDHDGLHRRARWIAELGVFAGGWLRRLGLDWLYDACYRFDHARTGASVDAHRCSFRRWAVSLARLAHADVVVTGHTHVAARSAHGDKLFLNSGTCSEGQWSFLALDTRAGAYGVHSTW